MIEPLRIVFEVACPPDHAFSVWTERISTWWPADHTVSAEPDLTVVLEGRPGGRIYERRSNGNEHDWGEVTVWEPPTRLGYTWHLKRERDRGRDPLHVIGRWADASRDRASRVGASRGRGSFPARSERRRLGNPAAALCRGDRSLTRPGTLSGFGPEWRNWQTQPT